MGNSVSSKVKRISEQDKNYIERQTPIMGWSSWNNYRINISEALIKLQIDALISTGLADAGYTYCNVDDGFFYGRDEKDRVRLHPERFPNGIKVIADYAHERGLKAGTYSEGGSNTCAHIYDNPEGNSDGVGVGLYGHYEEDVRMYLIEGDFDFIKVDWCGGLRMGLSEQERYTKIGNIIEGLRNEKGKDIIYNVCRWQFPGDWVVEIADSWRVSADIELSFESILKQIDDAKDLAKYNSPGHVNDLDMLQVGRGLSQVEDLTHFAMWCMMATPLMLGNDLTNISEETLEILKNKELIAINQDSGCVQATVIAEGEGYEVYLKPLTGKGQNHYAVAVLNRSIDTITFEVDWEKLRFSDITFVRNILCEATENSYKVEGHGILIFNIKGAYK